MSDSPPLVCRGLSCSLLTYDGWLTACVRPLLRPTVHRQAHGARLVISKVLLSLSSCLPLLAAFAAAWPSCSLAERRLASMYATGRARLIDACRGSLQCEAKRPVWCRVLWGVHSKRRSQKRRRARENTPHLGRQQGKDTLRGPVKIPAALTLNLGSALLLRSNPLTFSLQDQAASWKHATIGLAFGRPLKSTSQASILKSRSTKLPCQQQL